MDDTSRDSGWTFGRFLTRVVPAWVFIGLVFVLGSLASTPEPSFSLGIPWDKVAHFGVFLLLYPLALRAERFVHPDRGRAWLLVGTLFWVSAVGALLELYQVALPHRSAELADWVADTLGAAFAAGCVAVFSAWRHRRG